MEHSSENDLIRQIKRYQDHIQQVDPPENDSQKVLHYMRKLAKLPIKLDELEKTGIGKTINALRKRNGSIAEQATLLVAKWKSIVKKQVQEEEEEMLRKNYENVSQENYNPPDNDIPVVDDVNIANKKPKIHEISLKKSGSKIKDDTRNNRKSSKYEEKVNISENYKEESISDRKRKHSDDDKEKYTKKEKYKKPIELSIDSLNVVSENISKLNESNKVDKKKDFHEDKNSNSHLKKRKEKQEDKKSHKKDHDKKHKSSKYNKEKDKHHRRHSKSSHHDKKKDENVDSSKNRNEKKNESKNISENDKPESSDHKHNSNRKDTSTNEFSDIMHQEENSPYSGGSCSSRVDNEDCGGFGAALLEISQTTTPVKKKNTSKLSNYHDSSSNFSIRKNINELELLPDDIKVEPLDLDYLSSQNEFYSPKDETSKLKYYKAKTVPDDETFSSMTTKKNKRTKVFSGIKSNSNHVKFPTLFELCVRILQENFDALEFTGGVPYDVLKPILEKVTVEQLYNFENYNPYLIGDTDELWEFHAKKHFRKAERQEYETWRDLYLRCVEEREEKLQSLTENISQSIANSTPIRKTKLAYLDSVVKPPRNVARSQAKHGTGALSIQKSPNLPQSSQTAVQSLKERMAREVLASPTAVTIPSRTNPMKKKKAPLMQKTLQLFKGLKR